MTGSFGDSALRWCGVAARLLGWTPGEFWRATPTELLTSLRDPQRGPNLGPSRELIAQLMERDSNG